MSYIYKIENLINHKLYIGQTSLSIQERFQEHIRDANKPNMYHRPLYSAIKKYGADNFQISLIEECSPDIVAEREKYWISTYNTYMNGYNATMGGEGSTLYDHDAIKHRLLEHPYASDIAQEFGCCIDIVRDIAKRNNIKLVNNRYQNFISTAKAVNQYTKDGQYIQTFPSVADAARWCYENRKCLNLNSGVRSHIAEVCNKKRTSAYGYVWQY